MKEAIVGTSEQVKDKRYTMIIIIVVMQYNAIQTAAVGNPNNDNDVEEK